MELLDRIKTTQGQHGWSDGDFADAMGISQSVWSRIKNGLRPLDNVRFLRAVARAMPELRWHIAEYVIGGNNSPKEEV
jgi:transcriptional regulator with XRE-family HTH domain|tara:strand:+ start:394 stop:627 length:234 start_codon:yes stop_codon:yes gene_type:complete